MKIFTLLFFFFLSLCSASKVSAQANAYVNILTQNSGQVNVGGAVFIEVTVGNTGPVSPIGANKLRAQISVPAAIVSIPATGHVLPAGWIITVNTGSAITVCNGSDVIAVGSARTILINVQGNSLGGPSTVGANLLFSSGTSCTTPGSLPGDNTSDNSSTSSIQVLAACPLAVTVSAGTIACNSGTTTLTATATGTSAAVEYSINGGSGPFQPLNTFTVGVGTYTVTAREVATPTCIATAAAISITEPAIVPEPIVAVVQPTCATATGTISITSSTAGFDFSLDGNAYAAYPTGGYPVVAGPHTVRARNASGCTSSINNITIDPQPVTPAAPTVGTITQPTCAISTGAVILSGLPAGNWTINPGAVSGSGSSTTLANLSAGIYNFTVTNDVACTSIATASVVIDPIAGVPGAPTVDVVHPTCSVATGTITIASSITGLTFSLDGGNYDLYPAGGYIVDAGPHTLTAQNAGSCISAIVNITVNEQPGIPDAPTVDVVHPTCAVATAVITITTSTTGLTFSLDGGNYDPYPVGGYIADAGPHTLTAQNAGSCISAITNVIVNSQPATPTASVSAGTIACNGGTTVITVTASGGIPPYEYSLDTQPFQTGNTFTVIAGSYIITVKDSYPCSTSVTAIVIPEPSQIMATVSAGTITCNGGNTTLIVTASGGTAPYEYSLNGGAYQQSNNFTITAGVQTITVKDANACTQTATAVTVTEPGNLIVSATAPWIVTCGGTTTATVTASGGTSPYTGTGTYVKGPGTWDFTVTDAAGCSASSSLLIEPPGCVELEVFPNPASNSISVNHSIAGPDATMQVFEINGALVISKSVPLDAFLTTIDIRKLSSGIYVLVYRNGKDKRSLKFDKINR